MATTQFESVDARRAFPCFDEPDRKAVFDVTLTVDADVEAISNSPVVADEPMGDKRRIRFSPTMKMSTYLVAFVIGQLESTETVDVDGVPLRVVTTPGKSALGTYALEVGAFALRFFTEYFDIPYPGEKVDLVAIPDFAAGAMENLGCITFRDTALLVNPDEASRTELERVADVISHELAHMWFGDLVTMGWWEGIWLNEAFATFMEMLCVDDFRPSWDRWVGSLPPARLRSPLMRCTPLGRSNIRWVRPRRRKGCSTSSPTRRAPASSACSSSTSAPSLPRRCARLSEGTCLRQHRDDRPVGRARRCQRRPRARRHEHLHPPGRSPADLARRRCPASTALRTGTGAPRHHVVHRKLVEGAGGRARPSDRGTTGSADAQPDPRRRPRNPARGRRRTGRGQCGWLGCVPRRVRDRSPPGPGRASVRADRTRAGGVHRRYLGHDAGRAFWPARVPAAGLPPRARARPRALDVGVSGLGPEQSHRAREPTTGVARRGGRPVRADPLAPWLRRPPPRQRSHPHPQGLGHQPLGHHRCGRGGPGRSRAALRRLADRRGLRPPDLARHRGSDAGCRGSAAAGRGLRRPARALPGRRRRPRRRCVPSERWPSSPTWTSACARSISR